MILSVNFPSGYIPKNLHNFGHRYAENCHVAFTSFDEEQAKQETLMSDTIRTSTTTGSSLGQQHSTPLCASSSRAKPYLSTYVRGSARLHESLQKHRMSGYTGFVPKARKYLGQSYPIITRKALQVRSTHTHTRTHTPLHTHTHTHTHTHARTLGRC